MLTRNKQTFRGKAFENGLTQKTVPIITKELIKIKDKGNPNELNELGESYTEKLQNVISRPSLSQRADIKFWIQAVSVYRALRKFFPFKYDDYTKLNKSLSLCEDHIVNVLSGMGVEESKINYMVHGNYGTFISPFITDYYLFNEARFYCDVPVSSYDLDSARYNIQFADKKLIIQAQTRGPLGSYTIDLAPELEPSNMHVPTNSFMDYLDSEDARGYLQTLFNKISKLRARDFVTGEAYARFWDHTTVFSSEEERIRYFRYNVDKYIEYEKEVYKILIDLYKKFFYLHDEIPNTFVEDEKFLQMKDSPLWSSSTLKNMKNTMGSMIRDYNTKLGKSSLSYQYYAVISKYELIIIEADKNDLYHRNNALVGYPEEWVLPEDLGLYVDRLRKYAESDEGQLMLRFLHKELTNMLSLGSHILYIYDSYENNEDFCSLVKFEFSFNDLVEKYLAQEKEVYDLLVKFMSSVDRLEEGPYIILWSLSYTDPLREAINKMCPELLLMERF